MLDFESLTSGAPVPPVNPDDVKRVWRFIWEAVGGAQPPKVKLRPQR